MILVFPQEAGTDYQIDLAAQKDIEEEGHLPGRMLTIPVEMDNVIISPAKTAPIALPAYSSAETCWTSSSSCCEANADKRAGGVAVAHRALC